MKHPAPTTKMADMRQALLSLREHMVLRFSASLPVEELSGKVARIVSVRSYRFGPDTTISYSLSVNGVFGFHLTVIQDDLGVYLGLSRELPSKEWDAWFDPDALDFFLTPSSARILKLRSGAKAPAEWSAPRYNKVLEAVQGVLSDGIPIPDNAPHAQKVEYSLLASDNGEKAIEIERISDKQTVRLYATIYRPQEDILSVQEAPPEPVAPVPDEEDDVPEAVIEEALAPLVALTPKQPPRPDFRRRTVEQEAVLPVVSDAAPRLVVPAPEPAPVAHEAMLELVDEEVPALPSFLLAPQVPLAPTKEVQEETKPRYLALDEVIPPEPERLRCDVQTARRLIEEASDRAVPVADVVRGLLGLPLRVKDEVMFDLPLSEEDYKELAMRYQIKASHREEIRHRLSDELRRRIGEAL